MSSALAGGFLTTAPPGKSLICFLFKKKIFLKSDRERQIVYDLTYIWVLKKWSSQIQRTDWWLPFSLNKMSEGDQKVQISSYKKINPGDVMCSMVTIVHNTVLYI